MCDLVHHSKYKIILQCEILIMVKQTKKKNADFNFFNWNASHWHSRQIKPCTSDSTSANAFAT